MRNLIGSFALVLALPIALNAQNVSAVDGAYGVRDFVFANGEQLSELRLHYRTLGTAQRNPEGHVTNAVLIMHGTMGGGDNFL